MLLYRLRVELDDEPGQLGRAATALGSLGVNVIQLDVQSVDGRRCVDDLLVELTQPIDVPSIEVALRGAGCEVVDARPAVAHELSDTTTRSLELAAHLVADAPVGDIHLGDAVARLVGADRAWIGPAPGMPAHGAAARALVDGSPVQAREPLKSLPEHGTATWSLALPFSSHGRARVLVVARRGPRFSFTETARAQALLHLAGPVLAARTPSVRRRRRS